MVMVQRPASCGEATHGSARIAAERHRHLAIQAIVTNVGFAAAALLDESVLPQLEDPLMTCVFVGVVLASIAPLLGKALPRTVCSGRRSSHV